jgi:single-strand DNA-binding protein
MGLPRISFLARLTRQSETSYTGSGMCITKVGLACSEKYKDKESVFFITGTAFNKTAEMIAQVNKGQRVYVNGKIQTDRWEDKNSGEKKSATSMIIENFEFIEPKQDNQQQNQDFQQPQNNGQRQGFQSQQPQSSQGGFQGPPDDSIPF